MPLKLNTSEGICNNKSSDVALVSWRQQFLLECLYTLALRCTFTFFMEFFLLLLSWLLYWNTWGCTRSFLALSCLYDGNLTHFLIGNLSFLDTLWRWPWKNNVVHAWLYYSLILFLSASFQSRFSLTFKLPQDAINARQTVKPVNDVSLFTGN